MLTHNQLYDYGKARGILLAMDLLGDVCPFSSIDAIPTPFEWETVKGQYDEFVHYRFDKPLGNPDPINVHWGNGFKGDVKNSFEQVKKVNPEAVLLILKTQTPQRVRRYAYEGGFSILFHLDQEVIVELVGAGFDGHEVTQGLTRHERYRIPWSILPSLRNAIGFSVDDITEERADLDAYRQSAKERLDFLVDDCGYPAGEVLEFLPMKEPIPVNEVAEEALVKKIILPLGTVLRKDVEKLGLEIFGVQGNVVNNEVQVWEIFSPNRWH